MPATYDSAVELTAALRRAAEAHGRHEAEIGHPDPDWPEWYAQYMVDEQSDQAPARTPRGRADEPLRRHRGGRRLAGRALRRRTGRRWPSGRRRRTPTGGWRVLLLGLHPFQDAAAPRGGGPGGTRGGVQCRGRCRGGPGLSRFHGLELLRCRPGTVAGGQGHRPAAGHRPAGRSGRGRSGRCAPHRGQHRPGHRLGSGRAPGAGPGRP